MSERWALTLSEIAQNYDAAPNPAAGTSGLGGALDCLGGGCASAGSAEFPSLLAAVCVLVATLCLLRARFFRATVWIRRDVVDGVSIRDAAVSR